MLFDSQIQDLTRLIDDQLIAMQRNFPNEPIVSFRHLHFQTQCV